MALHDGLRGPFKFSSPFKPGPARGRTIFRRFWGGGCDRHVAAEGIAGRRDAVPACRFYHAANLARWWRTIGAPGDQRPETMVGMDSESTYENLVQSIRGVADSIHAGCHAEISWSRRFRDDSNYRENFNQLTLALFRNNSDLTWPYTQLWPTEMEPRPLHEPVLNQRLTEIVDLVQRSEIGASWGKAHCIAAYWILRGIRDGQIETLKEINIVRRLGMIDRTRNRQMPGGGEILFPIHEEDYRRWGRLVWPDEHLNEIVDRIDTSIEELRFVCDELERLARLHEVLVADPTTFTVHYRGRECTLGPGRGFLFLKRLADSPNQWVENAALSEASDGDPENDNLAPVKNRLCNRLRETGMGDLADCIMSERGHYGLFLDGVGKIIPRAIDK